MTSLTNNLLLAGFGKADKALFNHICAGDFLMSLRVIRSENMKLAGIQISLHRPKVSVRLSGNAVFPSFSNVSLNVKGMKITVSPS